mmetsp:Transcript_7663/g.14317  ORF Transcript_7663/g.14317 Transcript_7663/m.14317 type:complete len:88 (-) Transcript_7663:763-1026(-)
MRSSPLKQSRTKQATSHMRARLQLRWLLQCHVRIHTYHIQRQLLKHKHLKIKYRTKNMQPQTLLHNNGTSQSVNWRRPDLHTERFVA